MEKNFIRSENEILKRKGISEKWGKLGLLDGLHGHLPDHIAKLYECCPSTLIQNLNDKEMKDYIINVEVCDKETGEVITMGSVGYLDSQQNRETFNYMIDHMINYNIANGIDIVNSHEDIEEFKNDDTIEDNIIPQTLEEAVDLIISRTPLDQIELAKTWDCEEFLGNTHHFLGMNIRNEWNLWYNDSPLCKYFTSIGINHGDDRSGMILDSVYRKINDLPIDIEGQIERYKKYWKEAGFKDGIHPILLP